MRRAAPSGLPLLSHVALGAASVLLLLALGSALRAPAPVGVAPAGAPALVSPLPEAPPGDAPEVALASDPFSPDRLLPDDAAEEPPVVVDADAPARPAVRLLGTVVRGAGGFALCQLSLEPPRIVRVGERLGELTLITLEQGRVVFRAPDGARLELSLSHPGP